MTPNISSEEEEEFSREVHAIMCRLGDWLREEQPDAKRLLPALAVVLGRVSARTAADKVELQRLITLAHSAMTNAAKEYWKIHRDN